MPVVLAILGLLALRNLGKRRRAFVYSALVFAPALTATIMLLSELANYE